MEKTGCAEFQCKQTISRLCFSRITKTRWSAPTNLWDFSHPVFGKPHERKCAAAAWPSVFILWILKYHCPGSLPSARLHHASLQPRCCLFVLFLRRFLSKQTLFIPHSYFFFQWNTSVSLSDKYKQVAKAVPVQMMTVKDKHPIWGWRRYETGSERVQPEQ